MPEYNIVSDRRVFERVPVNLHVDFKDVSWDFSGEGETEDVSGSGVRLRSAKKLDVDDFVEFNIQLPDSDTRLSQNGFVLWSKEAQGKGWVSGIRFREIALLDFWKLFRWRRINLAHSS